MDPKDGVTDREMALLAARMGTVSGSKIYVCRQECNGLPYG